MTPLEKITAEYVKAKMRRFEKRFNKLKTGTRRSLTKHKISVKRVVDTLMIMPASEHKDYLQSSLNTLSNVSDHSELFGALKWNCLSYQLLDHLISEPQK